MTHSPYRRTATEKRILFFSEKVKYNLRDRQKIRKWLNAAARTEKFRTGHLNIVFCDDRFLLGLHKQYLHRDTLTDIITFDYGAVPGNAPRTLYADVFISIPRARENAMLFKTSLRNEVHRLLIHGLLHLCGYKDKKRKDRERMKAREDYYLSLRAF